MSGIPRIAPAGMKPDPDVIEMLRKSLRLALSGDLRSVVVAGRLSGPEGSLWRAHAGGASAVERMGLGFYAAHAPIETLEHEPDRPAMHDATLDADEDDD